MHLQQPLSIEMKRSHNCLPPPILCSPAIAASTSVPRAPRAQSLRGSGGFELPHHHRLGQFATRLVNVPSLVRPAICQRWTGPDA